MEGLRTLSHKRVAITAIGAAVGILAGVSNAQAGDFDLNFEAFVPDAGESIEIIHLDCRFSNAAVSTGCERGGTTHGLQGDDPDRTPFYEEIINTDDGRQYYHVIVGDPDADFAQEYYVQAGWGIWLSYGNFPKSASGGTLNGGIDATPTWMESDFLSPLAETAFSGNGTGAPEKVTFRQIVRSPGFEQEITKAHLAYKPVITQTVVDDELDSDFSVDMSNITYDDDTTSGAIINTMTIIDKDDGTVWTDFDMNTAPQAYTSNAKYTISGGTGVAQLKWFFETYEGLSPAAAEDKAKIYAQSDTPTYSYAGATEYDIYAVDWAAYWNADENVPDI
ncbi:hypothetical protein ACFL2V_19445 [Pseudomonadota bacterium]